MIRAGLLLLFTLACAGCGRDDGADPHAGQVALVPSDHAYRLWYLVPPWQFVASTGTHAELRVASGLASGFDSGASPPPHVIALTVDELAAGAAPHDEIASRLAMALAGGASLRAAEAPAPFAMGATGFQASSEAAGMITRVAATTLADGRTVVLTFVSGNAIERSADIDDMLAHFEPRPPSP